MVTKAKQWRTFEVLRLSSNQKGYDTSKYASNFKFLYYHLFGMWLLGTTNGKQWWTFEVLRLLSNRNGYSTSKYASSFKFPYYHPLSMWLLGTTSSNQTPPCPSLYPSASLFIPLHPLCPLMPLSTLCASIPSLCHSVPHLCPFPCSSAPLHYLLCTPLMSLSWPLCTPLHAPPWPMWLFWMGKAPHYSELDY